MKIVVAIMLVSTLALAKADISLKSGYNYNSNNNIAQSYYMQQQQQQQQHQTNLQQQQPEYNSQNIMSPSFLKANTQYLPQTQNPNQLQLTLPHTPGYSAPTKQQPQQQKPQQPFPVQYPMPNDFPPSKFNLQPAVKPVQRYRPRMRIPKKAIVTKNFYIHSAPEETQAEIDEELAGLQEQPRKHYNVLFVKAPSQTNRAAALNFARALKEEKTVVYVLAKKTSAADLQDAVQESHQHDSKPEVFFIKYRTPEEADNAQRQIQSQYDRLGGSTTITDEGIAPATSVIGALDMSDDLNDDDDVGDHQPQQSMDNAQESVSTAGQYDQQQLDNLPPASSNNGYLPPSHQY